MSIRAVKRIIQPTPTIEGAGVKLRRGFGFGDTTEFDPFLLFDDFRNDVPRDFLAGFPWHPHRGIETITYVLAGNRRARRQPRQPRHARRRRRAVDDRRQRHHSPGDAAAAIAQGRMHGFQLWANLPASLKMTAPRYQDVTARDIPTIIDDDGTRVRVVCGEFWGKRGPVEGIAADPSVSRRVGAAAASARRCRSKSRVTRSPTSSPARARSATRRDPLPVMTDDTGDLDARRLRGRERSLAGRVRSRRRGHRAGGREGIRFLLVSGKPLEEPVAWHGPIVMNTEAELRQAFAEIRDGTFIK